MKHLSPILAICLMLLASPSLYARGDGGLPLSVGGGDGSLPLRAEGIASDPSTTGAPDLLATLDIQSTTQLDSTHEGGLTCSSDATEHRATGTMTISGKTYQITNVCTDGTGVLDILAVADHGSKLVLKGRIASLGDGAPTVISGRMTISTGTGTNQRLQLRAESH